MRKRSAAHYRIVKDILGNPEVQTWRWWWPFWAQERPNTHRTIETRSPTPPSSRGAAIPSGCWAACRLRTRPRLNDQTIV